ncbi:MAG: DUF169 domain-containing protein [Candidatus Methanofastidiosa archaeon]|nr:DUF169 domain-containing protein [Candidatus Methanofastidiosa archaeon]
MKRVILMEGAIKLIREFERLINSPVVGVSFIYGDHSVGISEKLRFCEHVKRTMEDGNDRIISANSLKCLGSLWAFGYMEQNEENLESFSKNLVKEGRFSKGSHARRELECAPRMPDTPGYIRISRNAESDLYIFYLSPMECMRIMQAYQKRYQRDLEMDTSGLMPICGQCSVRPYMEGCMIFSLGCMDSREHGGIGDGKIAIGAPSKVIYDILELIRK